MIAPYLRLLRPTHWIKNGLLFGGLIFGGRALESQSALTALAGVAVFCVLSSLVYTLNDLRDRERDLAHPLKRKRPLASGEARVDLAWGLVALLAIIGTLGSLALGENFSLIAAAYIVVNLLYSLILKQLVIIDVMTIAVGFVLRAWAGAVVIDVQFDAGLSVCTFLLALFLGFGKRRHELTLLGEKEAPNHRLSLHQYSPYLLDQLISIVSAAVVITYILYVVSPAVEAKLGAHHLWLTTPFVFYGVFRYLYLAHREDKGGSPTRLLLTDKPLLLNVILWLGAVLLLLYAGRW